MNDIFEKIEPMVYQSKISVPYHWWAGDTAGKFLTSLRDHAKILGKKCKTCNRVFIPPRKVCPLCFVDNPDWVELSNDATVTAFTIARRQLAALPAKVPLIFGLMQLDGADTAMLHRIDEIEPEEVSIGMRVTAHFATQRTGTIKDIAYFKPIKGDH